ncbi:ATP-grasp domain-containing protein [Limimonas halophila]|uniref:ATP-grasp domain-containing protein n=1 Tax=Limimonas halophila TaxID=1082479 RepID=A0A1G7Q256_9PROT|nr:ATP-grasp domain-containing protein [Limimonas halophila]SDF92652.1 ATP-grasp domain-containing protein [Limimonas halophila]
MTRTVAVIGLNAFNRAKLEALRGAEAITFHGILDPDELVYDVAGFDLAAALAKAETEIRAIDGGVDAIVGYMDFPVSTMLPLLCARFGTRTPTLESLLMCEHKYWSRLVQREVIPDNVPAFTAFDPFDPEALGRIGAAGIGFPFFVKPIKSSGARLGFRIDTPEDFAAAAERLRAENEVVSAPFNRILDHAELPDAVRRVNGHHCLAESIIGGHQCTVEGYVHDGEVTVYGIVDSVRYPHVISFFRYDYPSTLPERVQQRMRELAATVMRRTDVDNAPFNIEFFWDEALDRIWLLEINPRISESHCDLFEKVDGVSNQQVAIDLALGMKPRMPWREGAYTLAAKVFHRVFVADATVTRVPTQAEIDAVRARVPGTLVAVQVRERMRLSELPEQDSYSYAVAWIWLGAHSRAELLAKYRAVLDGLPFAFDEIASNAPAHPGGGDPPHA